MTAFKDLGLAEPLLRAVAEEGYEIATPIQAAAIPHLLAGRDVLGLAQTGTGKTAAFALPVLHRLSEDRKRPAAKAPHALILTPTRELAVQIGADFATYGRHLPIRRAVVFGGVGQGPQVASLRGGVDVVIATPGRLLDLINQGHLILSAVSFFVLDEADRMLDMGFIHDVKKIVARLPAERQNLLFSATMPEAVTSLSSSMLKASHERIEVAPVSSTAERIDQKVMFVDRKNKRDALVGLLGQREVSRAIVFTRTKHGANRIAEELMKFGVKADAIHGNKSQGARQKALNAFRDGKLRALVATDIAARGIDIDGVTHVINYDMPNEPESYVHRIGRTARAGAEGIALSFCDAEEVAYLRAIERIIQRNVPIDAEHEHHCSIVAGMYATGRGTRPKTPFRGKPQGQRPRSGNGHANAHSGNGGQGQQQRRRAPRAA